MSVRLHLVRHGRPVVDPATPAATWPLDPAAYDDVWALRDRLPRVATWYSSPEPKAIETAQLLTDGPVGVVAGLREHERAAGWVEDFEGTVRRAFARPTGPAAPGWEPLDRCWERVVAAVRPLRSAHQGEDVVLVGHATAWTLLAAAFTATDPDLDRWARMAFPDLVVVDLT